MLQLSFFFLGGNIFWEFNSKMLSLATSSMLDGNATATVNKLVKPNDCRRKPVVYILSIVNTGLMSVVYKTLYTSVVYKTWWSAFCCCKKSNGHVQNFRGILIVHFCSFSFINSILIAVLVALSSSLFSFLRTTSIILYNYKSVKFKAVSCQVSVLD
jgi:hypothetical protein